MEGDRSYVATLTEAVEKRHRDIESTVLPKLREQFGNYQSSVQSLMTVMVRKGLIQEDPYKTDQKISDVVMTDDTEFAENELNVVVGIRMSRLDSTLEYINNYVEFSVQALSFTEIRKLIDFARYIAWDDLKINSPKPTTRAISNLMGKLKAGADSLSSGLLSAAVSQLADSSRAITDYLKTLRTFQRERYKLELRTVVFSRLDSVDELTPDDPTSLRTVKVAFADSGLKVPFIPELASEIIREDVGVDAAERRNEALARLQIQAEARKKKKVDPVQLNIVLIDGIRSLAAASRSLEASMERLRENATIIQNRKRGLGSRLREWMAKISHRKAASQTYNLEFLDENTGTKHRETVELDDFLEMLHKKAQIYGGILSKGGSLWTKISKASEDQLYKFINQELGDMHLIHRRANAFDSFFKAQSTSDEKRKMRGIKIELTTIRNAIAKASQLKHEYSSRKEERDQLKKLGITAD